MQISIDMIYEVANEQGLDTHMNSKENLEFFKSLRENNPEGFIEKFRDNLALEYYGWSIDASCSYSPTIEEMRVIFEAAKIVFALHPGQPLTYDIESAYSDFSSPWVNECDAPEEWLISWARRFNETDEGSIDSQEDEVIAGVLATIKSLREIGVPESTINKNIDYICYGHESVINKVTSALNS